MRKSQTAFSPKEIAIFLNNTVSVVKRPLGMEEISANRLRKLREYSTEILRPLLDHVYGGIDEETGEEFPPGLLSAQELVMILVAAALYVQMQSVLESDKLPQARDTETLFNFTKIL